MTTLAQALNLQSTSPANGIVASIAPSTGWTGTAGTGFANAPSDPVRTTAKPAVRLLTPPYQRFTSSLLVGAMAASNNDGSLLDSIGIEKVIFHFEGTSVAVDQPKWQAIPTQSRSRLYLGWWINLQKIIGQVGTGHLYIEAVPRDASMQNRVIGPFEFAMADTQYDLELEVAPSKPPIAGQRFQSLLEASTYAKQQDSDNALCTITETGRFDIGDDQGLNHWYKPGYLNITASVPGVFLGKESGPGPEDFASNRLKLHVFGSNMTVDRRWVGRILTAAAQGIDHWFDGVTITTTAPEGRNELLNGAPRNPLFMFSGNPWFTECSVADLYAALTGGSVVRGCVGTDLGMDIVSSAKCVVQSTFTNHNDDFWNSDVPAFTVQYSGPEAVATLARSGGTEGFNGGTWVCAIGPTEFTFETGNGGNNPNEVPGTIDGYYFDDVVTWLNSLPDMTATLLLSANERAANSGTLEGSKGQGFSATDIKAAPLSVTSYFDKHGDFYQHETGDLENVILFGNLVDEAQVQCIFLSPDGGGADVATRDFVAIGNVFNTSRLSSPDDNFDSTIAASQIGRPNHTASHVVIASNSFVDQRWLIRTDGANNLTMDGYCLFTHNIAPSFTITGSAQDIDMAINANRLYSGAANPLGSTDTVIGGDEGTLFVAEVNSDYRPTGDLLSTGFAPAIPFDRSQTSFPATASVGALAAAAIAYIPPPIIQSSDISGTPVDGQLLTASQIVTGDQPITLSYQWQANGANIAGYTDPQILLNTAIMNLTGGDVISCEITATNVAGSDSVEPAVTLIGTEFAALTARLSGAASSGMWDFRQGTVSGTNLTVANQSGNLGAFIASNPVNHPTIDPIDGAKFDGLNDAMTLASGITDDSTFYLLLRKDPDDDAQGHILNSATLYQPGTTSSMAYVVDVDGQTAGTRGALHLALDDGAWHVLSRSGSLAASGGAINLARSDGFGAHMDVLAIVILHHADFPADLVSAQTEAQSWLATLTL